MKKYIILILLFSVFNIIAQETENTYPENIRQGKFLLGLGTNNVNLNVPMEKNQDTNINLNIDALYFLGNGFALGIFTSYNSLFSMKTRPYFIIGPQAKIYVSKKGPFVPYLEIAGGYLTFPGVYNIHEFVPPDATIFSGGLGGSYLINKNVSMDAGLQYTHMSFESDTSANTYGLTVGFSLFL